MNGPARATTGTVVLAHGSRSPHQREVVTELAVRGERLDRSPTPHHRMGPWRAAFLDHHGPSLHDAAADLIAAGCSRLVVVPALLAHAFHSQVDVPRVVSAIDPLVPVSVAAPIGPDPLLLRVVERQVAAWAASQPHQPGVGDVSIVIAAAGTSDVDARQAFLDVVNGVQPAGRAPAAAVHPDARYERVAAFVAGGDPDVPTAIHDVTRRGRVPVLAPFLLASGALTERAASQARAAGAVAVLDPLGAADEVVAILLARRDACATV